MSRRRDAGVQPEWRAAAPAARLSAAAAVARLRRQYEREMAASPESRGGAGLRPGRNIEIHGFDAGWHGAGIHLLYGSEIHHHPAIGRTKAQPARLPRDHGYRLEWTWQDQACRRFGG